MAHRIAMPRLGWTMERGGCKLVQAGRERVQAGEPLFSVESDKAVLDVEALESGTLYVPPDAPQPGDEVPVGTLLAYLLEPGEEATNIPATPAAPPVTVAPETRAAPPPTDTLPDKRAPSTPQRARRETPAISPRARRVARELGIDWSALPGSGRTGRIVERDIRAAAAQAARAAALPANQTPPTVVVRGGRRHGVGRTLPAPASAAATNCRAPPNSPLSSLVALTLRDDPPARSGSSEAAPGILPCGSRLRRVPSGTCLRCILPSYQIVANSPA